MWRAVTLQAIKRVQRCRWVFLTFSCGNKIKHKMPQIFSTGTCLQMIHATEMLPYDKETNLSHSMLGKTWCSDGLISPIIIKSHYQVWFLPRQTNDRQAEFNLILYGFTTHVIRFHIHNKHRDKYTAAISWWYWFDPYQSSHWGLILRYRWCLWSLYRVSSSSMVSPSPFDQERVFC